MQKIPSDSRCLTQAYETKYHEIWCHLPDNSAGFWITSTSDIAWARQEVERRARLCGWVAIWTKPARVHKERVKVRMIGLVTKDGKLVATTTHVPAGRIIACGGSYLKAVPLSNFRNGDTKARFYKKVNSLPFVHPKTGVEAEKVLTK